MWIFGLSGASIPSKITWRRLEFISLFMYKSWLIRKLYLTMLSGPRLLFPRTFPFLQGPNGSLMNLQHASGGGEGKKLPMPISSMFCWPELKHRWPYLLMKYCHYRFLSPPHLDGHALLGNCWKEDHLWMTFNNKYKCHHKVFLGNPVRILLFAHIIESWRSPMERALISEMSIVMEVLIKLSTWHGLITSFAGDQTLVHNHHILENLVKCMWKLKSPSLSYN
jgi:hypothetical protein